MPRFETREDHVAKDVEMEAESKESPAPPHTGSVPDTAGKEVEQAGKDTEVVARAEEAPKEEEQEAEEVLRGSGAGEKVTDAVVDADFGKEQQ